MAPLAVVIFDGDDTLWDTQPLYEKAKREFSRLLAREGLPTRGLRQKLDEIDHANVERLGYSRRRFPLSMRQTYLQVCTERDRRPTKRVADAAMRLGQQVFKDSPRVLAHVRSTLRRLRTRSVRCILLTKGDRGIQLARIRKSNLRRYFTRVYIVPNKRKADFLFVLKKEGVCPERCWSVGNSIRSDIAPAIKAGVNAIWIPRDTWIHEQSRAKGLSRMKMAWSIADVPKIVGLV